MRRASAEAIYSYLLFSRSYSRLAREVFADYVFDMISTESVERAFIEIGENVFIDI